VSAINVANNDNYFFEISCLQELITHTDRQTDLSTQSLHGHGQQPKNAATSSLACIMTSNNLQIISKKCDNWHTHFDD